MSEERRKAQLWLQVGSWVPVLAPLQVACDSAGLQLEPWL